jgi:hypothetical protein
MRICIPSFVQTVEGFDSSCFISLHYVRRTRPPQTSDTVKSNSNSKISTRAQRSISRLTQQTNRGPGARVRPFCKMTTNSHVLGMALSWNVGSREIPTECMLVSRVSTEHFLLSPNTDTLRSRDRELLPPDFAGSFPRAEQKSFSQQQIDIGTDNMQGLDRLKNTSASVEVAEIRCS